MKLSTKQLKELNHLTCKSPIGRRLGVACDAEGSCHHIPEKCG